ncbi:hypothetical protein FJTKL_12984 [Diaporthe vaccinii]|uniref:Uncharacterized protein n=1 Tax=Diaporthe vaccinii TaxID=105482 RepID=A0ABR4EC88_9PEZI
MTVLARTPLVACALRSRKRIHGSLSLIMGVLRSLVSLMAAAAAVSASPIERRAPIDSDKVVGFAETVPSGTTGSVYLAYKPYLKVVNGCVPFPAVNAAGDTKSNMLGTGSNLLAVPDSTRQAHRMAGAQAAQDKSTSAEPHLTATTV